MPGKVEGQSDLLHVGGTVAVVDPVGDGRFVAAKHAGVDAKAGMIRFDGALKEATASVFDVNSTRVNLAFFAVVVNGVL